MSEGTDDPGFVIYYDGYDPRLKVAFCAGCNIGMKDVALLQPTRQNKQESLKKCSACKLIYYCSRDCQAKDRKKHKQLCKKFKKLRANVDREASKIQPALMNPDMVGRFWDVDVGFLYLKARYDLALELHPVAYQLNILEYWDELIGHVQEVLRLGHLNRGQDLGARIKFPMFLISIGRLDDAYSVCRYMIKRDTESDQVDLTIQEGSKAGEWIYPRERHCRFNDFLDECAEVNFMKMEYYLTAVWLIKKKILSIYATTQKAWFWFLETDFGKPFQENVDVGFEIIGFLLDRGASTTWQEYSRIIEAQDTQLGRIADIIHGINPFVFPFMLEFVQGNGLRQRTYDDSEEEFFAWGAVNDCSYSLLTLPGLENWLIQFLERRDESSAS